MVTLLKTTTVIHETVTGAAEDARNSLIAKVVVRLCSGLLVAIDDIAKIREVPVDMMVVR